MEVGAYSHRGKVRKNNEDYFYIPRVPGDVQNLLIVADGMGGHNAGEVASFTGVNTVIDIIQRTSNFSWDELSTDEIVYQALSEANLRIYNMAQQDNRYQGMGTTMTMALLVKNEAIIGHVGDSRAYLLRENDFIQITRDHSLVEELVQNGSITQDEALHHPQKHFITRSLGPEKYVDIDVFHIQLRHNDIIFLCSDGLINHVEPQEVEKVLIENNSLSCKELAQQLVELAVERGGNDNVTVVIGRNNL